MSICVITRAYIKPMHQHFEPNPSFPVNLILHTLPSSFISLCFSFHQRVVCHLCFISPYYTYWTIVLISLADDTRTIVQEAHLIINIYHMFKLASIQPAIYLSDLVTYSRSHYPMFYSFQTHLTVSTRIVPNVQGPLLTFAFQGDFVGC